MHQTGFSWTDKALLFVQNIGPSQLQIYTTLLTSCPLQLSFPLCMTIFSKSWHNLPSCARCVFSKSTPSLDDRLSVQLMKVITMYVCSGNGHGNTLENHQSRDDMMHKDDDCKDYIGENKSSNLYFWEIAERFDILNSTMAKLDFAQINKVDCWWHQKPFGEPQKCIVWHPICA